MGRYHIIDEDWESEYLIDTEHPEFDPLNPVDSFEAIVCYISYDCPEDITFSRNLNSLYVLLNEQDEEIKRLKGEDD